MNALGVKRLIESQGAIAALNFGSTGIKADKIAESTSSAGVTFTSIVTLANKAHGAKVMGFGTEAAPYAMGTTAISALSFYASSTATADNNRCIYSRLYLAGAGSGGEALRAFGTGTGVGLVALRGAHISASIEGAGTVTGEMMAVKGTLMVPNSTLGGTNSAIQAELYADGASSAVSRTSLFGAVISGEATGKATLNTQVGLFDIVAAAASGGGDMLSPGTSKGTETGTIRIFVNGAAAYIPYYGHQGHA